ncbi:28372_t:CDS:1 [Dentiscutata erythropus]|uniref:28372_t:CDS:1 n=1 Tax=Dentiscutata erythropus TaxID=1348616 RepID=A0A9N9NE64_9GLOM|nr:28372_t:CDS:1 [Dentiscutata erythropus]
MQQMQQLLNQQAEAQHQWNAQILETINQKLMRIDQPNINNDNQPEASSNNIQSENNLQRIINSSNNNGVAQGNYSPTPIINNLILAPDIEDQSNKPADNPETIAYKVTSRKFLSFVYIQEQYTCSSRVS